MSIAVLVFALVLIAFVIKPPTRRELVTVALLGLVLSLVAQSTPRLVGDSGEYVAMSINLSRFSRPSLTDADLAHMAQVLPGAAGVRLAQPQFRGRDQRQDFSHFWFYSLMAAPFVAVATMIGAHPITGFTALNILLLSAVALISGSRMSPGPALLLTAGPILWWVDKAHTEVFTFTLLVVAMVVLDEAPWWSLVALGTAATQNPPMAAAMAVCAVYALTRHGWRRTSTWVGLAAGSALASLPALYYHSRLGIWSTLRAGVDEHWPSLRELVTVPFDSNLGIFIHDPIVLVVLVITALEIVTRAPRQLFSYTSACVTAIALVFLVSFTQTTNFNSGGTSGPSRYGLWLLPLVIPALTTIRPSSAWIKVATLASIVWCSVHFAPRLPEEYLKPTSFALTLWQRWPNLDNPLVEIFAERVAEQEPSPMPPLATPGCEKVLLVGDGTTAEWPARCTPATLPRFCREKEALCYANKTSIYTFRHADASPVWLRDHLSRDAAAIAAEHTHSTGYALPPMLEHGISVWLEEGWSYLESAPDPLSPAGNISWRWMADRARIGVLATRPSTARLILVARASDRFRRIRISRDGTEVATLVIAAREGRYETPPFSLAKGENVFTLESLDGADSPGGTDKRRLSVAIFHVEVLIEP